MKTAYHKAMSFCLVLLILTSVLCGCTAKDGVGSPSNEDVITDTSAENCLPDNSGANYAPSYYDGASFTVACSIGNENSDVFFDESSPREIDRLIKERNDALEKKLGIKITELKKQNLADYIIKLSKSQEAPDMVYASGNGGMTELMLYGSLAPLSDYKGQGTMAGVSVSVVQQLSVYGNTYMLTGAPIRSSLESATVVAYNTRALSSLGYEDGYLCQLVVDGYWTLDKMTAIAKQASVQNAQNESYRAVSGNLNSLYSLWKGLGARTIEKANGDVPTVAVYSSKNVYLFEEVNNFSIEVGGIPDTDKSLFYIGKISDADAAYKEDYGVLPTPAYNEGGEYACLLDFDSTFFTAMPTAAENKKMTLDFLGEFYAQSVDTVYPEITGKSCYKSTEVLDIILKSRYFDFLDMYGIGHIVSTAFYSETDKDDFDLLLKTRADFACDALRIALGKSVGENTNK